jgi:hypothetical protein
LVKTQNANLLYSPRECAITLGVTIGPPNGTRTPSPTQRVPFHKPLKNIDLASPKLLTRRARKRDLVRNPYRPVSQLASRPVGWLWPGRLALGKLAIVDGDPGLGKSLVTLDLCAPI